MKREREVTVASGNGKDMEAWQGGQSKITGPRLVCGTVQCRPGAAKLPVVYIHSLRREKIKIKRRIRKCWTGSGQRRGGVVACNIGFFDFPRRPSPAAAVAAALAWSRGVPNLPAYVPT